MYSTYKDEATFLTIYIKEAHAEDEWQVWPNNREGVCYKQPTDLVERMNIAFDFRDAFEYAIPLVIDRMDNDAMTQYSGWPERLYIIDENGRIAYKGHAGPFRYRPGEVEAWLAKRFPE